ncbi:MAG: hypothetical protein Kow0075_00180 [Salibacteraceae bacterium]
MRKSFLFFVCLFLVAPAVDGVKLVREITYKAHLWRIDQLNNLYAVNNGELVKFDANGNQLTRYSNKLVGNSVMLDVTNPMKVSVYAPDQQVLLTLDSRLAEMRDPINFTRMGYEQVSLACLSHTNRLWIYDALEFRLVNLSSQLDPLRTSLNLAQLLRVEFFPTDLKEFNQNLYLTDPNHGVFQFDQFGNYVRKIPIKGIHRLVISDNHLYYAKGEYVFALNLTDFSEKKLISGLTMNDFDISATRLVTKNKDRVYIYERIP